MPAPPSDLTNDPPIELDAVVIGGGIAGLWTLDELRRRGHHAVLLEHNALGAGQTIWSQGIVHGGLKYTLSGALTPAARAIRELPELWRTCLAGEAEPDLSAVHQRAPHCWLWRTEDLSSKLGAIGARVGLRAGATSVTADDRPDPLRCVPGTVARVDEPVVNPASLMRTLAQRNQRAILKIDPHNDQNKHQQSDDNAKAAPKSLRFERDAHAVYIHITADGRSATLRTEALVLCAGNGNAPLRAALGLDPAAQQIRPLRMVMVRAADLPHLSGHCVDAAHTRVTITSDTDDAGRTVWQLGGEVAERAADMTDAQAIAWARRELLATIPALNPVAFEWCVYDAPRAEGRTRRNTRPDQEVILKDPPVYTAWPTKLVLAPIVAQRLADTIGMPTVVDDPLDRFDGWPIPPVAPAPWDEPRTWTPDASVVAQQADTHKTR